MSELRQRPPRKKAYSVFKIECDCGNIFQADPMTECKQCGAHYEIELNQVAPPIGSES